MRSKSSIVTTVGHQVRRSQPQRLELGKRLQVGREGIKGITPHPRASSSSSRRPAPLTDRTLPEAIGLYQPMLHVFLLLCFIFLRRKNFVYFVFCVDFAALPGKKCSIFSGIHKQRVYQIAYTCTCKRWRMNNTPMLFVCQRLLFHEPP